MPLNNLNTYKGDHKELAQHSSFAPCKLSSGNSSAHSLEYVAFAIDQSLHLFEEDPLLIGRPAAPKEQEDQ